ncbi:MAG: thioredoxin domain-containing protein [Nitrospirae bacterium]|nr:thioredoxin domain-containing protein [Nitrospirota bacterium]
MKDFKYIRRLPVGIRRMIAMLVVAGTFLTAFTFSVSANPSYAAVRDYPEFGNDKAQIEITVYSDYFCPHCSSIEEPVNTMLKKLKDRARIRFVDVPIFPPNSIRYAEVFLYSWFANGDNLDTALKVRNILFSAARNRTDQQAVMKILKSQGIAYTENKGRAQEIIHNFYERMAKYDSVASTPIMIVVQGLTKKTYNGSKEILDALGHLPD